MHKVNSFMHSQNDMNLAVGIEETKNGGERDGFIAATRE